MKYIVWIAAMCCWVCGTLRSGSLHAEDAKARKIPKPVLDRIKRLGGSVDFRTENGIDVPDRVVVCFTNAGDSDLKDIVELTTLRSLDIANTRVSSKGVALIASLPELKSLRIDSLKLTTSDIKQITKCRSLENLSMVDADIGDDVAPLLAGLPHLTDINLNGTRFDDKGVDELSAAHRLHSIKLGGTKITNACLRSVQQNKELTGLNVAGTVVDDNGAKVIATMQKLKYLVIGGPCKISDAGVGLLCTGLPGLRWLSLEENNKITDRSVPAILGLRNPMRIDIDATGITPSGESQLKHHFPHVTLHDTH